MKTILNPYINFDANAREAMEFYKSVFGGELTVSTFKDLHASQDPSQDELVMHSMLATPGGLVIMGADTMGRDADFDNRGMSVSLSGSDEAELTGFFDKLCQGGTVLVKLEKAMWGDMFGMCTDKFKVTWLVNVNSGDAPGANA